MTGTYLKHFPRRDSHEEEPLSRYPIRHAQSSSTKFLRSFIYYTTRLSLQKKTSARSNPPHHKSKSTRYLITSPPSTTSRHARQTPPSRCDVKEDQFAHRIIYHFSQRSSSIVVLKIHPFSQDAPRCLVPRSECQFSYLTVTRTGLGLRWTGVI